MPRRQVDAKAECAQHPLEDVEPGRRLSRLDLVHCAHADAGREGEFVLPQSLLPPDAPHLLGD